MTNLNSSGLFAQLAYKAYLTELNERLKMDETPQITITDTNGQSAVYVPKPNEDFGTWETLLAFTKKAKAELTLDSRQAADLLIALLTR